MMSFKEFKVQPSKTIPDVFVIKPSVFNDHRGNIYSTYNKDLYKELLGTELNFIHDKFAESKQNVLRGLHGDNKTWKLVSCVYGQIYEVVVDMRPDSPTYLKWDGWELNSDDYRQVLIPPNFVNGYFVKSKSAVFHYKLAYEGKYIDAAEQITIAWDDKRLGIDWPTNNPILQERDKLK